MPNHIDNKLTIVGNHDAIRAFVDRAYAPPPKPGDEPGSCDYSDKERKPSHLSFHAIVPLSKEYSEQPYSDFGYNQEHNTWGVKWGAYDVGKPVVEFELTNTEHLRVTYEFQTAWGCPRKWITKASKNCKELLFVCSYGGEGPARGKFTARDGVVLFDQDDEYRREDYPQIEDSDEGWEAYKRAEHKHILAHAEFVQECLANTPSIGQGS
jgi:hypothetical protein